MKWQIGFMSPLIMGIIIGASISGASAHPESECLPPPPCPPCPQLEFSTFLTEDPVFMAPGPFVETAAIHAEQNVEQHEAVLRAFEAIEAVEEQEAEMKAEKEVQEKK